MKPQSTKLNVNDFDSQLEELGIDKEGLIEEELELIRDMLWFEGKPCSCPRYQIRNCDTLQGEHDFITMNFGCEWAHTTMKICVLQPIDYKRPIFLPPYPKNISKAATGMPVKPNPIRQVGYLQFRDEEVQLRIKEHIKQVEEIRNELPHKPEFNGLYLYKAFKHVQDDLQEVIKDYRKSSRTKAFSSIENTYNS